MHRRLAGFVLLLLWFPGATGNAAVSAWCHHEHEHGGGTHATMPAMHAHGVTAPAESTQGCDRTISSSVCPGPDLLVLEAVPADDLAVPSSTLVSNRLKTETTLASVSTSSVLEPPPPRASDRRA
jgi:hypothetical protein